MFSLSDPVMLMQHLFCLISVFAGVVRSRTASAREVGSAKKISPFSWLLLRDLTLYLGWADRIWRGKKKELVRRELLESMHYVSYPTEEKTALRVGMRAAGGAAR